MHPGTREAALLLDAPRLEKQPAIWPHLLNLAQPAPAAKLPQLHMRMMQRHWRNGRVQHLHLPV